jgi:hypothetical protein
MYRMFAISSGRYCRPIPVRSKRGSSEAMQEAILRSAMSWGSSSSSSSSGRDFSVGVGEKVLDDPGERGGAKGRVDCRSSWARP